MSDQDVCVSCGYTLLACHCDQFRAISSHINRAKAAEARIASLEAKLEKAEAVCNWVEFNAWEKGIFLRTEIRDAMLEWRRITDAPEVTAWRSSQEKGE